MDLNEHLRKKSEERKKQVNQVMKQLPIVMVSFFIQKEKSMV